MSTLMLCTPLEGMTGRTRMRLPWPLLAPVLAGVALASVAGGAGRAGSATEPSSLRTLVALTVPITQFAQDGGRLAWMTGGCKDFDRPVDYVAFRTISAGRRHVLAPRVCGWDPVSAFRIVGRRIAWAENVRGQGRIRSVTLPK